MAGKKRKAGPKADENDSPIKKRATTAGRGTERDSTAVSNGRTNTNQSDPNADICTACSGDGLLVCCEGCFRAYHLTCCEPPVEEPPASNWYCNKCSEDRAIHPPPTPGLFLGLVGDSRKKNTSAYTLPPPLRNYFEGVATGEDGEFEHEEANGVKTKKTTRGGYEEPSDNFKIKDGKDTIFCFRCSGSALPVRQTDDGPVRGKGGREMIQCDYCNLSWHLDCLDPPLAVAPSRSKAHPNKPVWMCPNHIDSELNNIVPNAKTSNQDGPTTRRRYRIRRPKNAVIADTALSRGVKNNGLIEIINDPSDDETLLPAPNAAPQITRASERAFKLDFIDRVKRHREEEQQNARLAREAIEAKKAVEAAAFDQRPFIERKAALNLMQMAQTPEASISTDKVQNLIGTLIAEAPENVGELAATEDGNPEITAEERKDLEALIELAQRRLTKGKAK